jgi:hypothetical protein
MLQIDDFTTIKFEKLKTNCSTFILSLIDCVCILWVEKKAKPNFNSIFFRNSDIEKKDRAVGVGYENWWCFQVIFLFLKKMSSFSPRIQDEVQRHLHTPIKWLYRIPLLYIFHPIRSSLCFPFLFFPLSFLNLILSPRLYHISHDLVFRIDFDW